MPIKLSCVNTPEYKKSPLSFSQCEQCTTIQLDKLIPLFELYSESHNYTSVGKIWENYFKLFIEQIKPITKDKIILEIGCPSGKIALNIDNYKKWFIVEPNKNTESKFPEKVFFIEKFFDNNFSLNETVDIIIHSHLFEHIYDFNDFLKKCYELLCHDGEMFFGVPNMNYFTESNICPFLGIFFEHTCFLNKENISILLNNNNFEIYKCIDYENHSTLYHCKKVPKIKEIIDTKITNYYDSFMNTLNVYQNFVNNCNNIIKNSNINIYIFGASYNTQLLITLGLDINNVKGILDNCKEKQGKYLYGYNLQIYDPSVIFNKKCVVILKNGYYVNEIYKQLKNINDDIEIIM
jgi:SAM-dependent methyltransferase